MILDYINGQIHLIELKFFIIFFTWLIVLLAIAVDLVFGIKKSKADGIYVHSVGLRRTVTKVINYLAMMLFMLFFDALSPLGLLHGNFNILPLASVVGCLILVYIEFKSVREKSENKFRYQTNKALTELIDVLMKDETVLDKLRDKFKEQ